MTATQVLIDTARPADAAACGYGNPVEASMGGLKITFEADENLGPILALNGIEGEVSLTGEIEIRELIRAANIALSRNAALAAQAMKAA